MKIFSKFRLRSPSRLVYGSKEYVEHLRTVHFALLTVAAGLLLLVASAKPYDSRKAIMQMDGIIKLKSQWSQLWLLGHKTPSSWRLRRQGLTYVLVNQTPPDRDARTLMAPSADHVHVVVVKLTPTKPHGKPTFFRLNPPPKTSFFWIGKVDSDSHFLDRIPERLDLFAEWWNLLGASSHKFIEVVSIYDTCERMRPTEIACEASNGAPGGTAEGLAALETEAEYVDDVGPGGSSPSDRVFFVAYGQKEYLAFEAAGYFEATASQSDILDLFPGSQGGDFTTSFPDLARATTGIRSLDLESVSRYLQANSSSSEVFEAFGLKVASEQVTTWGTVVILCIQLYLYMYLQGLKKPLEPADEAWDVGWFAVRNGFLPRSIFFVTVFLLPAVAVMSLTELATDQRLRQASLTWSREVVQSQRFLGLLRDFKAVPILMSACLVSLLLGYLCWHNRPRVREEEATSRSG